MNQQELIEQLHETTKLSRVDAEKFLDAFKGILHVVFDSRDTLKLSKLGTFYVVEHKKKAGFNPQTYEAIEIKKHYQLRFRQSKIRKKRKK